MSTLQDHSLEARADGRPPAVQDLPDEPRRLPTRTSDDIFTMIGSGLGAFALTWLLYFEILPFSGLVGFIICWYFAFLAMYAGLVALANPRSEVVDRLMAAIVSSAAALVGVALLTVVIYTIYRGRQAVVHANFFTQSSNQGPTAPLSRGGILNCLVGSGEQVGLAVAMAVPLGLGTAVFMTEVGGWFARIVRTVVEAMTAVPDLLAGLFVYVTLILALGEPQNGLCVSLALATTMTPIIARSAEVALAVVPGALREAGVALGANQWQTVWRIVLPTAGPGLATSLVLAVARGVGESAPLLIVSGASGYFVSNPFSGQAQNSLPLYIYEGLRSGQNLLITRAYGAAIVLLGIVLILFVITRLLARQRVAR